MTNTNKKPKIAIISIKNSYSYGGVFSTLVAVHDFCQNYFQPTVFFLSFDPTLSTSLKRGKFSSSTRSFSSFGMKCVEIGSRWAFWEPGHYQNTILDWDRALKDFDYFFVVSGTCIAAHPLQLLNKKFVMWIGTPYQGDRAERIKGLNPLRALINFFAEKKMLTMEKNIAQSASHIWAISTYTQQHFLTIGHRQDNDVTICRHPVQELMASPSNYTAKIPLILSDITRSSIHFALQNTQNERDGVSKGRAINQFQKDKTMLLAVGRFCDPRKNSAMLLRVFEHIYKQKPETKLYVVGLPPSHDQLKSFKNKPFWKNIYLLGQISDQELARLYKNAYVHLITSFQEGLGIVGIEALKAGTPVVSTHCGGTADYVIDNVTGFLVPINNDQLMVEKIMLLLSNSTIHKTLSENGKAFVAEHYSIQASHTQFASGLQKTYPELAKIFQTNKTQRSNKSSCRQATP